MFRVLVALDNFGQLTQIEALFKKVGLDVDSVNIGAKFESTYLGLNPKVVVLSSHGKNVNGIDLAKKINRVKGWPKVIMVTPEVESLNMAEFQGLEVDYYFEPPIDPIRLLHKVAQLSGEVSPGEVKEKLERMRATLSDDDPYNLLKHVDSALSDQQPQASSETIMKPSTISSNDRQSRYEKWGQKIGQVHLEKAFSVERIKQYKKEVRTQQVMDDEMEKLRQDFAAALCAPDHDD